MAINGAIKDSSAYFLVGGTGKSRTLYLVSEVSSEGLTAGGLETEIKGLLRAAERTDNLWATKLDTPPAKKADAKGDKSGLTGKWVREQEAITLGVRALTFGDDGRAEIGLYDGNTNAPIRITRTGRYNLKGDQLTVISEDGKTVDTFTISVKDDVLTIYYKHDGESRTSELVRKK